MADGILPALVVLPEEGEHGLDLTDDLKPPGGGQAPSARSPMGAAPPLPHSRAWGAPAPLPNTFAPGRRGNLTGKGPV